ncbi:MAG TPA: hypothetical protein VFA07_17075 [Chthonomonadaceae bacterium]|nr:hypothetical protein [Chthonomonadaceae bacterium]
MVLNFWFKIPQGHPHYKVEAVTPVRDDVHVLAVTPYRSLGMALCACGC